MALKNFIKENFVLVVGLTLPVLLIVLFFLATVLPRSMATPPQYELLLTSSRYDYQSPPVYNVDFIVKDRLLHARLNKNTKERGMNYNWKKLMIYDGKTQNVRELPYDISKLGDVADGTEIVLDEFKNLQVDNAAKAPDGYEFDGPGYRGGMATDIFVGGSRQRNARVKKGAVAFKIPNINNERYGYNDNQFVGWIIQKQ